MSDHADNSSWRRLPIGAEPSPAGGVHFRVWAPGHRVAVALERTEGAPLVADLAPQDDGYHAALVPEAGVGQRYRYQIDGEAPGVPDPASRWQPEGPHGPSVVVDPGRFRWSDAAWRGVRREGQVIYELHVGTFTPEGTYAAAAARLASLAEVGVTMIELMPLAEFPGRFGWGYDGVDLFAPSHLYGTPDDLRALVDRAHALGLGVILDVVYNHLGPDGSYLTRFSPHYFHADEPTEWGDALNFDGDCAGPVRDFFLANAGYWIDEFHMDGLRLDATQSIRDRRRPHIVREVAERVRSAARGRGTYVVGENEPQESWMLREEGGGSPLDALWNDDFHHSALVALTGRDEAYFIDYRGAPQEFVSAAKYGFLFQGQPYRWQRHARGSTTRGLDATRFVCFTENHDQVANSLRGLRVHQRTSPGRHRAMTTLLLLAPQTPMLFQGQEFDATAPFLYFADHTPELAKLVRAGRGEFLAQFPSVRAVRDQLSDPADIRTFERCKLDWTERERHGAALALHRELLALRRDDAVIAAQGAHGFDGAVLGAQCFLLRWFAPDGDDRLLIVNLGRTAPLDPAPEPLLAPVPGTRWSIRFSSEDPRYGGDGIPPLLFPRTLTFQHTAAERDAGDDRAQGAPYWRIPGECAVLLAPEADATHDEESDGDH